MRRDKKDRGGKSGGRVGRVYFLDATEKRAAEQYAKRAGEPSFSWWARRVLLREMQAAQREEIAR